MRYNVLTWDLKQQIKTNKQNTFINGKGFAEH